MEIALLKGSFFFYSFFYWSGKRKRAKWCNFLQGVFDIIQRQWLLLLVRLQLKVPQNEALKLIL